MHFSTENFFFFNRSILGNSFIGVHRTRLASSQVQTSKHKHIPLLQDQHLPTLCLLSVPNLLFSNNVFYSFVLPLQIIWLAPETVSSNLCPHFSICSTWWPADSLRNSSNVISCEAFFFFLILLSPEPCGYFGSLKGRINYVHTSLIFITSLCESQSPSLKINSIWAGMSMLHSLLASFLVHCLTYI